MKFIFTDEQFSKDRIGGDFTAVTAAIFDVSCMEDFRIKIIKGVSKILGKDESYFITGLPILHGSDLLTKLTENEKRTGEKGEQTLKITDGHRLAIHDLFFNLINSYDVHILRLGYYDAPMKALSSNLYSSNILKVDHVLTSIMFSITNSLGCNHVYVHELDRSGSLLNYNDTYHQSLRGFKKLEGSLSIDLAKILGKFYCDKKNYFMYAVDLTSHALLKKHKKLSKSEEIGEYHNSIVEKLDIIKGNVKSDLLKYPNDFKVIDGKKIPFYQRR